MKPWRCDAQEPAGLDILVAKQSKQSKAARKQSHAKQGEARQNKATIGFCGRLAIVEGRGPSEGDARIAILDGEAGRGERYWAVVEGHGEDVEGLGEEGQGAIVQI